MALVIPGWYPWISKRTPERRLLIRALASVVLAVISNIFDHDTARFFILFGAGVAIGAYATEKQIRSGKLSAPVGDLS